MEEQDKKYKVEKSYEIYKSYDLNMWALEFFDEETGGYVVVNRERLARAGKSSKEKEKHKTELEMSKVFARNGYAIDMLEEDPNVCSYDVLIDGRPADLKKTSRAHNIYKYAKEAVRKQGAEIVLFQLEENSDAVQWELLRLLRRGYEAMYFFTNEQKVHIL